MLQFMNNVKQKERQEKREVGRVLMGGEKRREKRTGFKTERITGV